MQKRLSLPIWLLVLLGIIIVALSAVFAFYEVRTMNLVSAKNGEIASVNMKCEILQNEHNFAITELASLKNDSADMQGQLATLHNENFSLNLRVSSLQDDNLELRRNNSGYQSQITSIQTLNASVQLENSSLESQNANLRKMTLNLQTLLTQSDQKKEATASELALYKDTYGTVYSDTAPPASRVELQNNSNATNPTWGELRSFLLNDPTDQKVYLLDSYDCKDFSRDVHNNAEKSGIRSAVVLISFKGQTEGHACNAFKTTDNGLVFTDSTGVLASESGLFNCDKLVDLRIGKEYQPVDMFPANRRSLTWRSLGVVESVSLFW